MEVLLPLNKTCSPDFRVISRYQCNLQDNLYNQSLPVLNFIFSLNILFVQRYLPKVECLLLLSYLCIFSIWSVNVFHVLKSEIHRLDSLLILDTNEIFVLR